MLVYSHHITPRLQYIVDYLNEKLGLQAVVTNDAETFKAHPSAKINYSTQRLAADELFIQSSGLLHEDEIRKQYIHCFEWKNSIAFFQTNDDVGFDIFSAIFY